MDLRQRTILREALCLSDCRADFCKGAGESRILCFAAQQFFGCNFYTPVALIPIGRVWRVTNIPDSTSASSAITFASSPITSSPWTLPLTDPLLHPRLPKQESPSGPTQDGFPSPNLLLLPCLKTHLHPCFLEPHL